MIHLERNLSLFGTLPSSVLIELMGLRVYLFYNVLFVLPESNCLIEP